jgi:hypothetical protein
MRILLSFLAVLVAWPVVADSPQDRVLQRTVYDLPTQLVGGRGVGVWHAETNGLEPKNIVIADATVGGNDDVMEHFTRTFHGRTIAEELVKSYQENEQRSERVSAEAHQPIRVVRLDSFMGADGSYDWDKLNLQYPEVKAIVLVSKPAIDSLATFAVVRYEVITRKGFAWGAFLQFEKHSDGSWQQVIGLVGDIRRLNAPVRQVATRDRTGT